MVFVRVNEKSPGFWVYDTSRKVVARCSPSPPVCLSQGVENVSFYIQRLPSRPGARFRPLECHIHPAVAQSEGGCEFAGLAEGGEVGRAEGAFVRRRARITGGRSGRVRRCFVAPEQGRRRSATFDRTGRDVRSGIGRSCRI